MKTSPPLWLALVMLAVSRPAASQILISELAPTNTGQITDEDNERPDWLEAYNAGTTPVSLAGYSLSDKQKPGQWIFPAIDLGPGERLLVFASGKNRSPDIIAPGAVNHWETILYESDTWRYFLGATAPPANWYAPDADDSAWAEGAGGLGYGDGDDATPVPAGTMSFFLRRKFTVADTAQIARLLLSIDYDDGFAAYLNGIEFARSATLPPGASWNEATIVDHEAVLYSGGVPESFFIEKNTFAGLLQPGDNVLALEIHNIEPASSDLSARVWLHAGISSAASFYGPTPPWFDPGGQTGWNVLHTSFKLDLRETLHLFDAGGALLDSAGGVSLQPGHALMRGNDDGAWCVTASPTPGFANGNDCLSGYSETPVFQLAAGFYSGAQSAGITGNGEIRYTTDGAWPDENDALYTGPVQIDQTKLLRARCFEAGKLPGPTVSATYFIDEPTTLPIVSVAIDPADFGEVYDSYSRKGAVSVEYFDADHHRQFATDAAGYVVGNWSVAFPQKSLQFDCDEEYGSAGEIEYPLFAPDKPIQHLKSFRIRNEDDDWTGARMRDRVVNELAAPTHAGRASYRNVAGFVNGEYWGHYVARERLDNYFCRDNFGADPDSVNMIKTAYNQTPYLAEYGTTDDFYAMSDFIIDSDLGDPANLQTAARMLDLNNFTDYLATEIFVASTDWLQDYFNNIRLFKTEKNDPWKFLLWDVSYSSGNASGCAQCDVLATTLNDPFGSRYGDMLAGLLINPEYKRFFINRFADLMNTAFLPARAHALIDAGAAEIAPEIDRHHARWGTGDSASWANNVLYLKEFYTVRPDFQRQHIVQNFGLDGPVDITLDVYPPGAGHIKISTVIPENLPWAGVYFKGNPVTLTAIPNSGFVFTEWTNSPFIGNPEASSFTADVTAPTTFRANFEGASVPAQLQVGEINYHSDPTRDAGDWIELHNAGTVPLDVSDWEIRDADWFHRFVLPTGTLLTPGARLILAEKPAKFTEQHPAAFVLPETLSFGLGDQGDDIRVRDVFGNPVEAFAYNDKKPWPRTPDGFGRTLERVVAGGDPNLPGSWFDGCIGGSPGEAFVPCEENPLVSEINYKPDNAFDAGDWLELFNSGAAPVDLGGWSLRDGEDAHVFVIPAGTILPAGGYRVFFQDDTKFAARYPAVSGKTGPLGFGLSGDGDLIRLYDATGRLQSSVCFNDAAPWPEAADGEGYTLELLSATGNQNDPGNWFAGCYGGSPGGPYDPACGVTTAGDLSGDLPVLLFPNPATDILTIRLPIAELYKVRIFNMLGREVASQEANGPDITVPLRFLPPGLFRVEVGFKERTWQKSMIKLAPAK